MIISMQSSIELNDIWQLDDYPISQRIQQTWSQYQEMLFSAVLVVELLSLQWWMGNLGLYILAGASTIDAPLAFS